MNSLERTLSHLPRRRFAEELAAALADQAAGLAPTTMAAGPVVGVLADTHCRTADDLPESVLSALAGSDLIVHCGDIGDLSVLDRLGSAAPVLAVRSALDPPADGHRLFDGPRLIRAGNVLIGVTAHVEPTSGSLDELFGTPVDVVLTGTTHVAEVSTQEGPEGGRGAVIVNPGSPTFPASGPASVAVVDVNTGIPEIRLIPIDASTDQGEN